MNWMLEDKVKSKKMKKQVTLFLIIIIISINLSLPAFTQNYKLLKPNKEYYFKTSSSSIFDASFRIDSIQIEGTDSIFYPYIILKEPDTILYDCHLILANSNVLGERIVKKFNEIFIFFNNQNDSILINPKSNLNDSWKLYKFDNGNYLEATVTAINQDSILGVVDSIIIINIQAKDSLNSNIGHLLNGKMIKFSQNHGLVQFYNIYNFPDDTTTYKLVGQTNPDIGIVNLTVKEIFNYNVGDEFHYEYISVNQYEPWNQLRAYSKKKILSKSVSVNFDTLTYEYAFYKIHIIYNIDSIDTTIINDTLIENIILSLSNNSFLNKLPFEPLYDLNSYFNGYSYPLYFKYNNRQTKDINNCYNPSYTNDSCWEIFMCDPPCIPYWYSEGLGGGYYNRDMTFPDHYYLVYYKKNSETWGTPIDFDSIFNVNDDIIHSKSFVNIYPNPVKSILYIDFGISVKKKLKIELYDVLGRIVSYKETFNKIKTNINIENLYAGIYFLLIKEKDNIIYRKKIFVE